MSMPSPINVIKDGCHYEVKVDAHYVSDEEMQTLRRYIATINDENDKLRELVRDMWLQLLNAYDRKEVDEFADRMKELGVDDG